MQSETDIASKLLPETGLPAIHLQFVRLGHACRPRFARPGRLVRDDVLGTQLQITAPPLPGGRQAVDREVGIRQDRVVYNIVKKYGIRIKRRFGQDHTVVKCFVAADKGSPGMAGNHSLG